MGQSESNNNILFIKYADDTLILEKIEPNSAPSMQAVVNAIHEWYNKKDLILNTTKTKQMFSNTRDNPDPPPLIIGNTHMEHV
jgi:hypothetical protein